MVLERTSRHQSPWQIIGRYSDEKDRQSRFPIVRILLHFPEKELCNGTERPHGADPADRRIHEGGDVRHRRFVRGAVEPHGHGTERPFVPRRLTGVGGRQGAVIAVHRFLLTDQDVQHSAECHGRPGIGCGLIAIERDIRQEIDRCGDEEEKHAAERDRFPCPSPRAAALLSFSGTDDISEQVREQHGQPRSGIKTRPLGRGPQPERDAARTQGQKGFSHRRFFRVEIQIIRHEQIHEQYKEHDEHIHGGDASLREMHGIQREKSRREKRAVPSAEKPLSQDEQDRQHGGAEQRRYHAPAEGLHAEYSDSERDELFAQRRMGPLVNRHRMQKLIGGSGVIYLIKVHAVEIRRLFGESVLFVQQRCSLFPDDRRFQHRALRIGKGDLIEDDLAGYALQKQISCCESQTAYSPREHISVDLTEIENASVIGCDRHLSQADAAVIAKRRDLFFLTEIDRHTRAGLTSPLILGKAQRAQVYKGEDRIDGCEQPHQRPVSPVEFAGARRGRNTFKHALLPPFGMPEERRHTAARNTGNRRSRRKSIRPRPCCAPCRLSPLPPPDLRSRTWPLPR